MCVCTFTIVTFFLFILHECTHGIHMADGDPALLASLLKSPTRSGPVHPVASSQPSLQDQLRAWEEEKEALRRYNALSLIKCTI